MRRLLAVLILPTALAQTGGALGTPASIGRGEKLFAQGCAVGYCHGAGGSAARSQRLRGRTFEREYLVRVIRNGIPNTAMPAWGDRLTDADIVDLTDYIQSLATATAQVTGGPAAEAAPLPALEKALEIPEEHRAGRELFFDLAREVRCSICHRLNGVGTSVGPDITKVSAIKVTDGPQVLRYGRPRGVRTVLLKGGERFPAVLVERGGASTRVFDLTAYPPVLRNLLNTEVQSIHRQTNWRHGGVVRGYTLEEMQAIWNYVRFVADLK